MALSDQDRLAELRERVEGPDRLPLPAWDAAWLIGEVEGLRTELAAALGGWQREAGAMIERGRELNHLRDLLGRLEWVEQGYNCVGYDEICPVCQEEKGRRHGGGCWMAEVLGRNDEDAPPPK